jgi:hypothetical protein
MLKTVNLLQNADVYVRNIAHKYGPRSAFTFKQQISNNVVVKSIYNDDVDVCFYFYIPVANSYVQFYCNCYNTVATGTVEANTAKAAKEILKQHFNVDVQSVKKENSTDYYFVATV